MTRRTKHLPIYKASYDLVKLITEATGNFKRDFRPTLGKRLQDETFELILHVCKANAASEKLAHIENVLEQISVLEMLTQLAFDLGLFSTKGFSDAVDLMESIGRQAGGWKKHARTGRL